MLHAVAGEFVAAGQAALTSADDDDRAPWESTIDAAHALRGELGLTVAAIDETAIAQSLDGLLQPLDIAGRVGAQVLTDRIEVNLIESRGRHRSFKEALEVL